MKIESEQGVFIRSCAENTARGRGLREQQRHHGKCAGYDRI